MHCTRQTHSYVFKLGVLIAAVGATAAAQAIVIDDFMTGPYSVTLVTPGSTDTAFQAAAVPGATRATRLIVESNPLLRDVTLSVGGGFTVVDNGTLADSISRVGYGYESDGSGGVVVDPLGLDLTSESHFRVDFLSNDLDNTIKVFIGTWNGTALDLSVATAVAAGGHVGTPFSVSVPIASSVGTANLAQTDVIVLEMDNQPSGDFAIANFSVVPEPGTMAVLGIGVASLLRRRKNAR